MTNRFCFPILPPNNVRKVGLNFKIYARPLFELQARGDFTMTNPHKYHGSKDYRIRLKGHLDQKWSDGFEQMVVSTNGADTILTGSVADQAALHGLLIRIRDLNLTLLSIECLEPVRQENQ
jgi:hypothetical protein